MRKIIYLGVVSFIIFGSSSLSWATCGRIHLAQAEGVETVSQGIEVGNTICPVGGDEIEEGKAVKVEHEGKIYNLCCQMCVKDFKKDPQKYIEKLEEGEAHEGHHHE